jgi:hypothetical protein
LAHSPESRLVSKQRERYLARIVRRALIDAMGPGCAICGRLRGRWHLDHPKGRDWQVRSLSRMTRMRRYLKDWFNNNLRLLCHSCNERDGAKRRWAKHKTRTPCVSKMRKLDCTREDLVRKIDVVKLKQLIGGR